MFKNILKKIVTFFEIIWESLVQPDRLQMTMLCIVDNKGYTHSHALTHTHTHTHTYIYTHTHTHIHIYIYIYIYTHKHGNTMLIAFPQQNRYANVPECFVDM